MLICSVSIWCCTVLARGANPGESRLPGGNVGCGRGAFPDFLHQIIHAHHHKQTDEVRGDEHEPFIIILADGFPFGSKSPQVDPSFFDKKFGNQSGGRQSSQVSHGKVERLASDEVDVF